MITASYYDTSKNEYITKEFNTDRNLVNNQILHCLKEEVGCKYFNKYCRDLKVKRSD